MSPIGVLGVGQIGLAVAQRLLGAGRDVLGYRRSSLDALVGLGGKAATSGNDVISTCALSFECLPNERALSSVIETMSVQDAAAAKVIVSLSSHSLAAKDAARTKLAAKNILYLDGEVSGTPDILRAGRASVFVSGSETVFQAHGKVFADLCPNTKFLGDFGTATKMKIVANQLIMLHTLAAAESVALSKSMGLDPHLVVETLSPSPAASEMYRYRAPLMASETFADSQASIATMQKYADLLEVEIVARGSTNPLSSVAIEWFRKANSSLEPSQDIAAIFELLGME